MMRKMKLIRKIILHICVICTLTRLTARVLDWYNPYMDFMGHLQIAEYVLYTGILLLGITGLFTDSRQKRHGRKMQAAVQKFVTY